MPVSPTACILYDFFFCMGGAEKTSLVLNKAIPGSKICVDFVNRHNFDNSMIPDGIIELGSPCTSPALNAVKGIHNFKSRTKFLKKFDIVIYSGSYAVAAVHNQTRGKRILYCHTLPRFAYDLYEHYLDALSWAQKPAFKILAAYTRMNYEEAFRKMDLVIANSQNVRRRIQNYMDSDALVINPPVDTGRYKWIGQRDYYLSTARIEKYKRVDLIVKAFLKMPDKKLIVTSGGSDLERLKKIAERASNIHFTDWVSENDLRELIGNAIATIYLPKDEDFGMSPVESMAAGKPVIGAGEGGILETVLHGETGVLIEPDLERIIEAVHYMSCKKASLLREKSEARSSLFNEKFFSQKIREAILPLDA